MDVNKSLEHRTRKQIYNYVYSKPGVSFTTIMQFLDLNKSTLTYHLKYLERAKQIISKREGRNTFYYCKDRPVQENEFDSRISEIQQRLLTLIKNTPGISPKELNYKTNINSSTINYNVNKLIEMKLIWKVKGSNGIGYEFITNEKLQKEVYYRLLKKLLTDEIDEETYFKIKKKLDELDMEQ